MSCDVYSMFDCNVFVFFDRMIHWAGRIEKELEKVLQLVTGGQQMKAVSLLYTLYFSLMASCDTGLHPDNSELLKYRKK